MRTRLVQLALCALLAPSAAAEIFVVDANNGPGTDFTDLPTAVATVQAGDTLLLRAGVYWGFATGKGITILGQGLPVIFGIVGVSGLPSGSAFALRDTITLTARLHGCAGTIFLEHDNFQEVEVSDCSDVRMRRSFVFADFASAALSVDHSSQLELCECWVEGAWGFDSDYGDAGAGGDGIWIGGASKVQIALSTVLGGRGGWSNDEWGFGRGGDGGLGVRVGAGSELILSGRASDTLRGGAGGENSYHSGYRGFDGEGLVNLGAVRYSGVSIDGLRNMGYLEQPAIDDPFLRAVPGSGSLHVDLHGAPGGNARLVLGREPRLPLDGLLIEPRMVEPLQVFWLGTIDVTGKLSKDISWSFPSERSQDCRLLLQGSVVTAGTTVRTSSAFLLTK